VLDHLGEHGRLDWERASVDTMTLRATRGGHVGANPVDRGKPGSKLALALERATAQEPGLLDLPAAVGR
jgi:hypothetical protein